MKRFGPLPGARDAALLWLACAVALTAGVSVVFAVLGAAVDAQHQRTAAVAALLRGDAALLAQRSALESQDHDLSQQLARYALDAGSPAAVARFVRLGAHIAAGHGAQLASVEERAAAAASPVPNARPAPLAFEAIPLEATLKGDYRGILATIRELAASPLPMQIEITSLARSGAPTGAPTPVLTARLHVTLERIAGGATDAPAHLTTPEDDSAVARSH